MRFITTPRIQKKNWLFFKNRALARLKLDTFDQSIDDSVRAIYSLARYLEHIPAKPQSLEESVYVTDIGISYAHFLAIAVGWSCGWVILRERKPDYDTFSVTSPHCRYLVYPLLLVERAYRLKCDFMVDLYEKITNGELPNSEAESFLDLVALYYDRRIPNYFCSLESDSLTDLQRGLVASCKFLDVPVNDGGTPALPVPEVLRRLREDIFASRLVCSKSQKKFYLANMAVLFGYCINCECGYDWGSAWFENMCGEIVVYAPDKRHYLKPGKILRREFESSTPVCDLYAYCERIKRGDIPEQECDMPEEIT